MQQLRPKCSSNWAFSTIRYGWCCCDVTNMLYFLTVATLFSAANAALDRNDALIGYSEIHHRHTRCQDKHDKCKEWQQAAQCLANPYYMRKACPDACQVPACFGYKPDLQAWKGHATDYHTRQYQTRYRRRRASTLLLQQAAFAAFEEP